MKATRIGQIEYLYKLHQLKRDAGDDPVFEFCIDWLIDKMTTAISTGKPLPPGIAALLTPTYGRKKLDDPAERAARVIEKLTSQGIWSGFATTETNVANSL